MRIFQLLKLAPPIASALLAAAPALAQTNLHFENGLDGWTTNVTLDPNGFWTAGFGTSSGLLGFTPHDGDDAFGYIYTGLGKGVPTTLSQVFTLSAGETLRGYVGFTAQEDPATYDQYDDNAALTINGHSLFSSSITQLGSVWGSTGWVKFSYTAPSDGDYTLQLAVTNGDDTAWPSGAVLDDISLIPRSQGAVPETVTWAMMVLGFGLAGAALRTRRRAVSFG
ncbi:MAG: PEPxxWA-CTERM sorting domain-containing protein [Sphingomonas sp.]|nr:PEPxxWA-CTERM sorting domain-containing protein [Sphingomonas sp.]